MNNKSSRKNIDLFKQFLNFYWLRPESALMQTLRSMSFRKGLKYFNENSIDVACGDGIFSFLTLGGEFNEDADVYKNLILQNNILRKKDTYDNYAKDYKLSIKCLPPKKFVYDSGCDIKENSLKRAKVLNFYKNTFIHNINYNFNINKKYNFVYSNSTYWSKNFNKHLTDLVKITEIEGHLLLQIKNTSIFKNYVQERKYNKIFGGKFTQIIDAGRKKSWPSLKSFNDIYTILRQIKNIKIIDIQPIYGDVMPHIWNFGLRPIFDPLYLMTTKINPNDRIKIKRNFNNIFFEMFKNYIGNFKVKSNPFKQDIEYTYILKKIDE